MRALQFFTQQPGYIIGCLSCYKMLLLLFCECEDPHCELTIDVLEHLIPHITRPDSLFKSLVVSLLKYDQYIGIQFCYLLWFYWCLSQGKADLLLYEVLKAALQSSSIAALDNVLKHFQTDISSNSIEEAASQIGYFHLRDFVRFVQLCDPAVARQITKQIMDDCENCNSWRTFKLLMDLQPHHTHYAIINSSAGPLDCLITSHCFSSPRKRTIYLTELYLLSRFSSSPSQKIREHILSLEPDLQAYEPYKSNAKDWDGDCNLSKDVLVLILSQADPITQLLTVPLVCKAWAEVRTQLMKISPAIHSLFISDIAKYGFEKIHYYLPWSAIFRSTADVVEFFGRIASFTCTIPRRY